jgi:hypothetical protein
MSGVRAAIFGVLTMAGGGLFLYSWFQPWWGAFIVALKENGITIFPYAMVVGGGLQDYPQLLEGADMPAWFFKAMWVYLGLAMGVLVYTLFLSEERVRLGKFKLSLVQLLVGLVGVSIIIFFVTFVVVVAVRASGFYNAPLQGTVFVHTTEHEGNAESYVNTSLQIGFWLACVAGPFLTALAVLRDKIVGRS